VDFSPSFPFPISHVLNAKRWLLHLPLHVSQVHGLATRNDNS
jgi:hypothetical protein